MKNENQKSSPKKNSTKNRQGHDKAPGDDINKNEMVKDVNLKGKKVDADPSLESDKPVDINSQDK